jgi:threonine synthase
VPPVQFYSTNGRAPRVDLKEAMLQGQAPDRGLYLPEEFPWLPADQIDSFRAMPYPEIAFEILSAYTDGILPDDDLRRLCHDAYSFDVPIEHVHDRVHVMRLDRGPTASFKDFAARMMARLIGRFVNEDSREILILTATSGDTGSAVASAFYGVSGIRVVVLFPAGEVTERQRRQMTTLGGNVRSIALDGKFDDCQTLVKQAFVDKDLAPLRLSSANSINIGRLLPQAVYYFYAASRISEPGELVIITVPSGNFGNMVGCVIASRMGLALERLVVPVNENDEFPVYLETGDYHKIEPSRACISNAMNVGHPSNLARLVALYGGQLDEKGVIHRPPDLASMRRHLFSSSISDAETRETILKVWNDHGVMLEPHGAVGWKGFEDYAANEQVDNKPVVICETAHPAKFPSEIERLLKREPDVPESLADLDQRVEDFDRIGAEYGQFKQYLLDY